jgi:hypothetical protein
VLGVKLGVTTVFEKGVKKVVLEVDAEMAKMISLVQTMPPSVGNKEFYRVYRHEGGTVGWKEFRRCIALLRGGDDAEAEAERMDREEADRLERETGRLERVERARIEREDREAHELAERERAERAAEREKQNEGGAMTTIRREDLKRGQDVWVRVRFGAHMKLRPARVNNVMRGAVNVTIDGEQQPRMLRFNEIELSPDATDKAPTPSEPSGLTTVPPAFAALADGRGVRAVERPQPAVERPQPIQSAPIVPSANGALDKVNAWIEQGSAMRENLVKQQAALQTEMDDLAAEALRIEEASVAKRAELARVVSLLSALDQMRAAAAA